MENKQITKEVDTMPKRPPKEWWNRIVKKLRKMEDGITNAEKIAGWLWYHHMKPATKRAILAAEKLKKKKK